MDVIIFTVGFTITLIWGGVIILDFVHSLRGGGWSGIVALGIVALIIGYVLTL